MKRFFKSLALGILLALPWVGAQAQQVNNYCWIDAGPPVHWGPCNSTNPLAVTGSFTPSGNTAVVGPTADGSPATTPPVLIAGTTDGTGTGTVGVLQVTTTGAATVAGPTADGSPATSAPVLIGGTADGSASGNVSVVKIDAAGLVYEAVTNWGGTALGAMANYGTSPGAVLVPGVNAFITNTVAVTNAPSAASTSGLTPTTTSALAANSVIKASAGNLYSFEVSADSTLSAAAWWIMIYNATSAPVDGAVTPLKCYAMPSGTTAFVSAFPTPIAFSTGITIGVSTTGCFTKTASTHAFISGDAQ